MEGKKKELKSSLSFVIEDHTHKHVTKLRIEPYIQSQRDPNPGSNFSTHTIE